MSAKRPPWLLSAALAAVGGVGVLMWLVVTDPVATENLPTKNGDVEDNADGRRTPARRRGRVRGAARDFGVRVVPASTEPNTGEGETLPPDSAESTGIGDTELASETDRLVSCTSASDAYRQMRTLWMDGGARAVRAVLNAAVEHVRATDNPRRAALTLALSVVEHELGDSELAAELLVEALLAMNADWYPNIAPLPKITLFAGGPNVHAMTLAEHERQRQLARPRPIHMSAAGLWGGGSPLAWGSGVNERYYAWVTQLATDPEPSDHALAATIWMHSVRALYPRQFPGHVSPAEARHVLAARPDLASIDDGPSWIDASRRVRAAADEQGAAWVARRREIADWYSRAARVIRRPGPLVDLHQALRERLHADVVWSLEQEVADRFTDLDGDRANRLRQLAAALTERGELPTNGEGDRESE